MNNKGLSGDLEALPLLDTLNALSRHRKTGPLTLKTESIEITIHFDQGEIRSVTASDQSLRIGQVLINQGFVTEEQIEQALALQAAAPQPDRIGDVLVDVGYATPAQITRAVAAQLEASLVHILSHTGGTFKYVPETPSEDRPIAGPLDYEPLVMNATFLADRWLADQTPEHVESLPEQLIDPATLDRLSPPEREVMQELVAVYSELHRLAWRIGISAQHYKHAVLRLLEQVMIRIATESHEDQQVTRRPNARREQAHLVDEFIDPWILEDTPDAVKDVLLEMLNGVTSIYEMAGRSPHGSDAFDHAVLYLLDEQLIRVQTPDYAPAAEEPYGTPVEDAVFTFSDAEASPADLYGLSRSEQQTIIAMLNGRRSLRQMAELSGLPMSLFRDGAESLVARGLIVPATE